MAEHELVYSRQADMYEQLILKEDYRANLPLELEKISNFSGLDVLELGAGTGRLTRWLARQSARITALDISQHMLKKAAGVLWPQYRDLVTLAAGNHLHLPVRGASTDMVISGWSLCYLVSWHPEKWRALIDQAMSEIKRVLRSGGKIILIETQGTGSKSPDPPENLIPYYRYLEESGFKTTWLRTDYRFDSMQEAHEITRLFFGEEMLPKIEAQPRPILPECTGIWWCG
jgi:ubiquinone/menaquinone biosynthesis C-methylase UbiE